MSILEHMEPLWNNRWRLPRPRTVLCMDVRAGCRHYTLYSNIKPGVILSVTVYDNVWDPGRAHWLPARHSPLATRQSAP